MNPNNSKKTIDDFISYLKKRQYSSKSMESYYYTIKRYLEWLEQENIEATQVSYNDLLHYMKDCSKRMTQRGIQSYIFIIRHFYNHLQKDGKVTTNPTTDIVVKGIKRKVLYHILEPHELNRLYNTYEANTLSEKRNRVMLGLLIYQGLKTFEMNLLKVDDIKLREGKIEVPGSRKSERRTMQLESHQVLDMYDYILQVRPEILKRVTSSKEALLVGEMGTTNISNFMTALMKRLRKMNPSVLNAKQVRASVITKWLKMYNLREVQYLAGHRYISSTEWYLENDLEGLQEEVQQFHPLG